MSNSIMNIMVPGQPRPAAEFNSQQVSRKDGSSFSQYVERKCVELDQEGKNMLGVKQQEGFPAKSQKNEPNMSEENILTTGTELLQQLMQKLEEFAQDNKDTGAGEWQLTGLDSESLEMLAEAAGMDPAQFAALNLKMDEQNGPVSLPDFFITLEKHFLQLNDQDPVTAPETSLPLLQTLLEKLGFPAEQVEKIAESSVNDLGEFDLDIFLKGLQFLDSGGDQSQIPLSGWETEQLQDMLAKAGLSEEMQRKFFPQDPAILHEALKSLTGKDIKFEGKPEFSSKMNLGQLKEMLQQTIADAELAAPKADMPAFLSQLEGILGQAAFKEDGVSLTPVVQGSVTAIFQELQKIIDQAKIRIEKVSETMLQDEELLKEWMGSGEMDESEIGNNPLLVEGNIVTPVNLGDAGGAEMNTLLSKGLTDSSHAGIQQAGVDANAANEAVELKSAQPRLRMSAEMQQFTMEQISQTVSRGLKNSQHHLTLVLYPKELGEVKVDMQVKDNQVSLAFVMENPKVKALLESNMQEFKNSMEQRGFVVQGCDVSVDHNSGGDDLQKQFELAKTWQDENSRRTTLNEITELLTAGQTASLSDHDGVINMMV